MDGTHVQPLDDNEIDEAATNPGRTLSGVQKKWLVYRDGGAFRPSTDLGDPATHIAKFNRPDLETVVQNESLSLQLGREVLGPDAVTVAQIAQVRGVEGVALVVERFDRIEDERLRLEDFAQILERPRGREFDGKYQGSYEEAASVIGRYSALPRIDLIRYFRLVVFNFVIGNADAHLKNFSLLEQRGGLRLSPAYDLVNTVLYQHLDRETALAIGGRKRSFDTLDRGLVAAFGADIGLAPRAVESALNLLRTRLSAARALQLGDHVQANDFRARYRDIVTEAAQRILT